MFEMLRADGMSAEIPAADDLYGWLVGAWAVRVVDYPRPGERREGSGEWHFAWVLEGRAVQDVWVCPPRADRTPHTPKPGNRYGTSVRMYHPTEGRWHVVWVNPVSGAINRLVARKVGADIFQEGQDDEGNAMRWVFTDITPQSARWYAERSTDGGASWTLEAEFFLTRG
jgi:hypothetical protein